ncbi:MAG TPA: serine hydrolase domain-containing protein [Rhizomicrobium sp.]|nr:serine hydrolase domain-containing protein [Rhizomicrobium sp.]
MLKFKLVAGALALAASFCCAVAEAATQPSTGIEEIVIKPAPGCMEGSDQLLQDLRESLPLTGAPSLTCGDLNAFFDGYMNLALGRGDIAGAVIAVVKNGHVIFEKGYGVSDVKTQAPVDPKTTMFRPGSVSKLFTWTAVMQLAEQHKVDLDSDINAYLDFKIPPFEGKPITLRNLMTHTPGFEETDKNLFVTDPKKMMSLGDALKLWVPTRVFAPGEVPAYSNYGAALAGYIVERVSGEKFEDYIANHILIPLAMKHSTFEQPLPKDLKPFMSKGYDTASSGKAQPYEMIPMAPAGALAASADDMTRFMIAHLNNGEYNGVRILQPETAIKMHGVAYEHTPGIPPMAYGFYHEDVNGHTIVGHGGDTLWFHSDLHLILDQHVGLFVSQNSLGKPGTVLRGPLFKFFMDRYFPAPALAHEKTLKTEKADDALVAGNYIVSRGSFTNILAIGGLLGQAEASMNDDGTLSVDALKDLAGNPKKFREVKPFVWREVHGRGLLIAKMKDGKVTEIVTDQIPQIISFLRAAWWQSAKINVPLFIGMLAMLALTVIFWPIKAILRWRYEASFPLSGRAATLYRLTRLTALCDLVLFGGVLGFFIYAGDNHLEFFSASHDWLLRIFQAFGLLGAIGTIAAVMNVFEAFGGGNRPWWTKITDVLIAIACILSVWYAFSQHLLVWSLNY